MSSLNKFIGSGIIFPLQIDDGGRLVINNTIELINTSIKNILNWPERIRFFNEAYGCRIWELLEEPDDSLSKSLAKQFIVDSLNRWERRIEVINSSIKILDSNESVINLSITYKIRSTKIEETFIFPFYKEINY